MGNVVIVPRAEHRISRKDIDPDAIKVLYRLRDFDYTAYLVGGGVRDLLLERKPKDFDVGTNAHPSQIKKLFRNCWIIGRRFRLAHVRFGPKTIEVATFRKNHEGSKHEGSKPEGSKHEGSKHEGSKRDGSLSEHENTFGTAEEDAFRRDFTINALFYDIATFSVIDYVGGLEDLERRLIRCIGDPIQRFEEDPVRMLRAVAFGARLGFTLDRPVVDAIRRQRHLMAAAAPARLIEEYYKILRSGSAEATFRGLAEHGLLEPVTPELQSRSTNAKLWTALADLDAYRRRFDSIPPTLTNPILLGSIIVPIGLMPRASEDDEDAAPRRTDASGPRDRSNVAARRSPAAAPIDETEDDNRGNRLSDDMDQDAAEDEDDEPASAGRGRWSASGRTRWKPPVLKIGALPVARRDSERLRQVLALQARLRDLESSVRARRTLAHRGPFEDALTWLEIHGDAATVVEHWRGFIEALAAQGETRAPGVDEDAPPPVDGDGVRRRRRRGGRRRGGRGRRSAGS